MVHDWKHKERFNKHENCLGKALFDFTATSKQELVGKKQNTEMYMGQKKVIIFK